MIKRSYFLLGFLALLGTFACKKDSTSRFDMLYPELYFTIPAGLDPFRIHFIELRNIPLNKDFYFNLHNVNDPDAVRIQPRAARITSLFGDVDMDFVDRISILVSSTDNPDQFFELFYRDPLPLRIGSFIDMIPTLLDFRQVIKTDAINLRIRMQLRAPTPSFIESRLDYSFIGEIVR
jgi:hypothetical protein